MFIAKVDATSNDKLKDRFNIESYPTLIWFVDGQRKVYSGGITADTIVNWVVKWSGPLSTEVKFCESLATKTAAKNMAAIFFGEF